MLRFAAALPPLVFAASPVAADVIDTSAAGFTVSRTVSIAATPDAVWRTLTKPSHWWSKDHSWSGDAANFYIDSNCFCEKLPGRGSVEHARVVFSDKDKLLRMVGAFGPLQAYAVTGVMTFELTPGGAKGTTLKMTYTVGGYMPGGIDKMAEPVDNVLGQQVLGLKTAAETLIPAK
ncbi:MAG: ATPase [Proteobacteria bacterium]|nr:ATPase [Pseudomonadota bacterium]